MVDTRRLTVLVASVSDRLNLPDGSLVVGLSGGADSSALGYLCSQMGRDVSAVHINHGLPDSSMMERAATAISQGLDMALDVRAVVVPDGPSPEGQARRVRYAEFESATSSEERLLTGHTRDDNVETVLFNLIRGSGPRGLGGIPYHRPHNVFRPMLDVTRDETREIAALAGLPFVDDPMNESLDLTRNVLRSEVIPQLSELNPRLQDSIARMAAAIASDNAYLDQRAIEVGVIYGDDTAAVAVGDLFAVASPLADRALKSMLGHTVGPENINAEGIRKLWSVASGESQSQQLGSGVVATRQGPLLALWAPSGGDDQGRVLLTPGRHRVGDVIFDVLAQERVCKVAPLSRWSALFARSTELESTSDGSVIADGELAWVPGGKRMPVAWYEPGAVGYLSVFAREESGWTSNP